MELAELEALDYINLGRTALTGTLPPQVTVRTPRFPQTSLPAVCMCCSVLSPALLRLLERVLPLETLPSVRSQSLYHTVFALQLAKLKNLDYLYLDGATISGTVPKEWKHLQEVDILCLNATHLSGTLPPDVSPPHIPLVNHAFDPHNRLVATRVPTPLCAG